MKNLQKGFVASALLVIIAFSPKIPETSVKKKVYESHIAPWEYKSKEA